MGSGLPVDMLEVGLEGLISRSILGCSQNTEHGAQEETSWACSLEIFHFGGLKRDPKC